jgi:hypothetical protein
VPVSSQLSAPATESLDNFIGESLSSLFRYLQDPSAEIMPFFRASNLLSNISRGRVKMTP